MLLLLIMFLKMAGKQKFEEFLLKKDYENRIFLHPTDDFITLIELIYSAEVNLATYCCDRNAIIYGVADCSYCNMLEII